MEFEQYIPIQSVEPTKFQHEKFIRDCIGTYLKLVEEHSFYQKTVRVALASFIKYVLEETGTSQGKSSRATRSEIIEDCSNLSINAAKLFSFLVNPKCKEPAMFKLNVEIRWDGEVKVTVEDCFIPKGFNVGLQFKFTTVGEFIKLPHGDYIVIMPAPNQAEPDRVSYKVASIHPNIVFIGSMFHLDYSQDIILGYAPLYLREEFNVALEEAGCKIWEKRK